MVDRRRKEKNVSANVPSSPHRAISSSKKLIRSSKLLTMLSPIPQKLGESKIALTVHDAAAFRTGTTGENRLLGPLTSSRFRVTALCREFRDVVPLASASSGGLPLWLEFDPCQPNDFACVKNDTLAFYFQPILLANTLSAAEDHYLN